MIKFFKTRKRIINELVTMIELADLEEYDSEDGLSDYHKGCAHGIRAALNVISKKDVPAYAIIRRGGPLSVDFKSYDETGVYQGTLTVIK
jgi:hypothetical protein